MQFGWCFCNCYSVYIHIPPLHQLHMFIYERRHKYFFLLVHTFCCCLPNRDGPSCFPLRRLKENHRRQLIARQASASARQRAELMMSQSRCAFVCVCVCRQLLIHAINFEWEVTVIEKNTAGIRNPNLIWFHMIWGKFDWRIISWSLFA